jgi:hypothetical protein
MGYKLVNSYESFGESKFFYKKNGEVA